MSTKLQSVTKKLDKKFPGRQARYQHPNGEPIVDPEHDGPIVIQIFGVTTVSADTVDEAVERLLQADPVTGAIPPKKTKKPSSEDLGDETEEDGIAEPTPPKKVKKTVPKRKPSPAADDDGSEE